ncbi:MAG: hypothetical protein ACREMY_07775 [bacterium]
MVFIEAEILISAQIKKDRGARIDMNKDMLRQPICFHWRVTYAFARAHGAIWRRALAFPI